MLKQRLQISKNYPHQLSMYYLGQEGFLLQYNTSTILIDPYLTDYVDRHCCSDTVLWKRNYPAPISPAELNFADYVFCTHDHYDHMDPDTLSAIHRANKNTKFIIPASCFDTMLSYNIPASCLIEAHQKDPLYFPNFSVIPLISYHESYCSDTLGRPLHLGYRFSFDDISLYHAGDCCLYDDLIRQLANTQILMLPINGRSYFKLNDDIIGNMTAEEAIILGEKTNASMIIPMHYDLYDINGLNPAHFTDLIYRSNSNITFHLFRPGEKYIYTNF